MRYILCTVLVGGLLVAAFNTPSAAQTGITIRPLLQSATTLTGQSFELPHFRNQVTAALTELASGGQTGNTTVLFPSVIYQIEGTVSMEIAGQAARTTSTGQALVAPLRMPFNTANRGTTSAKFLSVFFGEQGKLLAERASDSSSRGLKTTMVLQTMTTWTGEPILFPLSANQFTVLMVELAPGAANARHVHPPTEFIYVLDGVSSVEPSNQPRRTFNAGEGFVETTIPHVGANRGAVGGRVLLIFAGEAGGPLTVPVP
jgi:quercetin dioxygenase-like cupin family protein